LHEWCTDHGFTPHIAVAVDASVQVPRQFVMNGEIVLNIGVDATHGLVLGNEHIAFKARFGGVSQEVFVPVERVLAIYARENGQGMAFPPPESVPGSDDDRAAGAAGSPVPSVPGLALVPAGSEDGDSDDPSPPPAPAGRPALKRIK
jgi:stringent starvation protein B